MTMDTDPRPPTIGAGKASAVTDAATARIDLSEEHGTRWRVSVSASCHVRLGASDTNASTNDLLLAAGQSLEIEPAAGADCICCIAPSGGTPRVTAACIRRPTS